MAVIRIIFLLLLFTPPLTSSFSFSFPSLNSTELLNTQIICTGAANISFQGMQLTPDDLSSNIAFMSAGRVTYFKPLRLWDRASGNLTGFSTNFSFVMFTDGRKPYGDGLAFIMVPFGSGLGQDFSGSGLGYGPRDSDGNWTGMVVAVEFDTIPNRQLDPLYIHAGINIQSLRSSVSARWENNITEGRENTAWISYDATSMLLKLDFTSFTNSGSIVQSISHTVDLRTYLPERVSFGFSAATGLATQKNIVRSWNFSSTLDLDPTGTETGPGSAGSSPVGIIVDEKGSKTALIVGVSIGVPVIILALAFLIYCLRTRKNDKTERGDEYIDMDNEFERGSGPKRFPYNDLFRATRNFSEEEKLGEGGFGGVYRGFLGETNSYIAVKRVSQSSRQGLKEYASEVKVISQLRHKNLVQLIGWCHERGELLLVYEYMPNGSLDAHLFKGKSLLTWEVRYKIGLGLASGLLYLHEEWERCVVHRDIKTSNIMLDSSFNAKLGDFGLARFVDDGKGLETTVLAGTRGYMAPEYIDTGRATKESDIYSFGVVLLELACGRRTFDQRVHGGEMRLSEWVWSLYGSGRTVLDAADPGLSSEFDAQEMERLMVVGLWCAHPGSESRPSIRQAMHVLNVEAEMPPLPLVMPRYYPPDSIGSSLVLDASVHGNLTGSSNTNSSNATISTSVKATTHLSPR